MSSVSSRLFIAAAALALTAHANPLPPAEEAALRLKFQARQKETRTWHAAFNQTLVLPGLSQPVVSTGSLAYRAPAQMRLEFTQPAGEFVLVLGDRLFLQKSGKKLAEKSLSDDRAGRPFQSLLGLLNGQPVEEENQFDAEVSREGGNFTVVLKRKPDASRQTPKRITNIIEGKSLEVREVLVELPNGGTLRYQFSNIVRNRSLDEAAFTVPASP